MTDRSASPRAPAVVRATAPGVDRVFSASFTVGRDDTADLVLDGSGVSRRHAEVALDGGTWTVRDLGSANGTWLDGARLDGPAPLAGAHAIRLGEHGPELRLDVPTAGAPRAQTPAPGDDATVMAVPPLRKPDRGAERSPDLKREHTPGRASPLDGDPGSGSGRTTGEGGAGPSKAAKPSADAHGAQNPERGANSPNEDADASDAAPKPADRAELRAVADRYFAGDPEDENVGERTRFIRTAFAEVQKGQRRRYGTVVALVLLVAVAALGYAGWREVEIRKLRDRAQDLFVEMRELDVQFVRLAGRAAQLRAVDPEAAEENDADLAALAASRARVADAYEGFVEDLGVYRGLDSEEQAIYRMARTFGESELTIPPAFVAEVKGYIAGWKRSSRFQTSVRHAQEQGYVPIVVSAMRRHGLPAEFFYLGLQESNFNACAVGPPTRWGIAKGAWQFIPTTGERYGLRAGPRVRESVCDPLDDRHDFNKAADAAARYLADIQTHLSAASGLLAMASYNWGEGRVKSGLERIPYGIQQAQADLQGIPNTPRARNYWAFLSTHRGRMPNETKDYVMKIFSAAVVGQDPRLFGINMDPPLSTVTLPGQSGSDEDPFAGPPRRLGRDALRERERQNATPAPAPAPTTP